MSLQGTLETIPLPDVLSLLAATAKSGELRISAARGEGRLWFDAGRVVAADVPRAATPVDAVFELLRVTAGTFSFDGKATAASPGEPAAVEALLREAQERLGAWKAIEAVVPSVRCTVALAPELSGDRVTLSSRQWKDLVAVAVGRDVAGVMRALGAGEFEGCRTVKDLVDAGLVKVGAPREPEHKEAKPAPPAGIERPRPAAPRRAFVPVPRPEGEARPPTDGPSPEEAEDLVQQLASLGRTQEAAAPTTEPTGSGRLDQEHDEPGEPSGHAEDEPINRGMLLKFLSSVRP